MTLPVLIDGFPRERCASDFRLIQTLTYSPLDATAASNPYGSGQLGDYKLNRMGAGEFEGGAIIEANDRFAAAGDNFAISIGEHSSCGRKLDFAYIETEGDPWPVFKRFWRQRRLLNLKRFPYGFEAKLKEPDYPQGGDIWWALDANVQWAFNDGENGHLLRLFESLRRTGRAEFRG